MPLYALGDARPELPPEGQYWVAPNATLIGRVRLLPGASVWFGAVLRGDNDWITVGEDSNIQDNAVLHTDPGIPLTIGARVTVGHGVILHGATVDDDCLIGMGSTLLNRSHVHARSLVAANALLGEGKEFPAQSLIIGMPAKVGRALSDDEAGMLKISAENYSRNWRRYAGELRPL